MASNLVVLYLFTSFKLHVQPIVTKSQTYEDVGQQYIVQEVEHILAERDTEPSSSLLQAQIMKDVFDQHKKCVWTIPTS